MTRIVQAFLKRLGGEDPGRLALPKWVRPHAVAVARAVEFHRSQAAGAYPSRPDFPGDERSPASVWCELGAASAAGLEQAAARLNVTSPTLLTWAWGQALAAAAGAECAAVGQVRAGAPQAGCAGFSMQTVPLVIPRARQGSLVEHVTALRAKLLAMREVEQVPVEDLPDLFADFPGNPWPGGVLMVETGSIRQRAGDLPQVRSIQLRESGGGGLLASAFVLPELRLEVESDGSILGPGGAHSLLDHWASVVGRIADGLPEMCDAEKLTRISPSETGAHHAEDGGETIAAESITRMWARSVSQFGNQPALETGGSALDYQALDAQARALAGHLRASGVIAGEPVASLLEDRARRRRRGCTPARGGGWRTLAGRVWFESGVLEACRAHADPFCNDRGETILPHRRSGLSRCDGQFEISRPHRQPIENPRPPGRARGSKAGSGILSRRRRLPCGHGGHPPCGMGEMERSAARRLDGDACTASLQDPANGSGACAVGRSRCLPAHLAWQAGYRRASPAAANGGRLP